MASAQGRTSVREIVLFFLRLGLSGFGGPAAHIALMEREAVERRAWLTREQFLDLVGGCNLLPGPSSTQVAMALGFKRRGWTGLTVAGACFILPAAQSTLALAWAYVRYGHLPQTQGLLYGAKPVMVAIVVQAIWRLGRMALRRWTLALLGVACFAVAVVGVPPIAVLLVAGALELLIVRQRSRQSVANGFAVFSAGSGGVAATGLAGAAGLLSIALTFLKLGVVVFGSGYVLLAFLKADLVDRLHWISDQQLIDAVTAGQVTPGPLFATATFLGYLMRGWGGAAVATIAIFLPSFFMAGAVGAFAGRIRASEGAAAFLDGVNVAAVALMAQMAFVLGRAPLVDVWTWALFIVSAALLLRFRVNATWVIACGAGLGVLSQLFR
jgi:chromate transporter